MKTLSLLDDSVPWNFATFDFVFRVEKLRKLQNTFIHDELIFYSSSDGVSSSCWNSYVIFEFNFKVVFEAVFKALVLTIFKKVRKDSDDRDCRRKSRKCVAENHFAS